MGPATWEEIAYSGKSTWVHTCCHFIVLRQIPVAALSLPMQIGRMERSIKWTPFGTEHVLPKLCGHIGTDWNYLTAGHGLL